MLQGVASTGRLDFRNSLLNWVCRVSFKNCPRGGGGATGGIWILRKVMIVNMWNSFRHNLGWLGYVWSVCVHSISYIVLSLMGRGTPKFGAYLDGVYST